MSAAREEILRRVQAALADVPSTERPADVEVARAYRRHDERDAQDLVELFAQRVADYHADVRRVPGSEVGAEVAAACARLGLRRVVIAPGLPAQWRPDGIEVKPDGIEVVADEPLSAVALDTVDGAITGCAAAIAETGTLVLDGQAQSGRRALTLVPDHHICVVGEDQIVGQVPEAIAELAPSVRERRVPVTLVSGPSASSDIELSRVEGVHGPRRLLVLIAG